MFGELLHGFFKEPLANSIVSRRKINKVPPCQVDAFIQTIYRSLIYFVTIQNYFWIIFYVLLYHLYAIISGCVIYDDNFKWAKRLIKYCI